MGQIKLFTWWRARINTNTKIFIQYHNMLTTTENLQISFTSNRWKITNDCPIISMLSTQSVGVISVTVGPIISRRWEIRIKLSIWSPSWEKFYRPDVSTGLKPCLLICWYQSQDISTQNIVRSSHGSFDWPSVAGCVTTYAAEERLVDVSISL